MCLIRNTQNLVKRQFIHMHPLSGMDSTAGVAFEEPDKTCNSGYKLYFSHIL